MIPSPLGTMIEQLAADGHLAADEVLALRGAVYPDGAVLRSEADALVRLVGLVQSADTTWPSLVAEALADHVLNAGAFAGHVDEAASAWLQAGLSQALGAQQDVLIGAATLVLEKAESAPAGLSGAVRAAILRWVGQGPLSPGMVEQVRRVLYAAAGLGDVAVTMEEAAWLFDLDQASAAAPPTPAFTTLFVGAVSNYVVGHGPSRLLGQESQLPRAAWLAQTQSHTVGSFMKQAFGGGFSGWWSAVWQRGPNAEIEAAYEARTAAALSAETLEPAEANWVLTRISRDGKTTANEQALASALGLSIGGPGR